MSWAHGDLARLDAEAVRLGTQLAQRLTRAVDVFGRLVPELNADPDFCMRRALKAWNMIGMAADVLRDGFPGQDLEPPERERTRAFVMELFDGTESVLSTHYDRKPSDEWERQLYPSLRLLQAAASRWLTFHPTARMLSSPGGLRVSNQRLARHFADRRRSRSGARL